MPIEAFDRFTLLRTSYGMGIYRQLFSFVNVFHVDNFENSVSPERVMFSFGGRVRVGVCPLRQSTMQAPRSEWIEKIPEHTVGEVKSVTATRARP
jgi:hypothetical protein